MKMAARSHTASELPLEELLALYGYEVPEPERETCHLAASLPDMTLDKDQITKDLFPGEEEEESSADDLTPSVTSNTSDLLRRLQGRDKDTLVSSSEEDSDDASVPSNEERKDIMVGSMYQAKIPSLCPYTYQERAYDSEDQLLWSPGVLPVQEVEEFLLSAQRPGGQGGAAHTQMYRDAVRDNEQALYELVKCNFNAEEALRRLRFNVKVFSEELCAWSEEECRNFEHGYRVYGKNFHLIQANKGGWRSGWGGGGAGGKQQFPRLVVSQLPGSGAAGVPLTSTVRSGPGQTRGGGPPPAQTNAPLSLKAVNSVHTGHRKQAEPAGKQSGRENERKREWEINIVVIGNKPH
uniref:mesoderm induction early response protein 2 isoform X2 n=1 Tax=Centroberyx gerrardi TaxID=166262 RepID=UPI003AAFB638